MLRKKLYLPSRSNIQTYIKLLVQQVVNDKNAFMEIVKNSAEWTNSAKACFGIPEGVQRYVEWLSLFRVKWHLKTTKTA